MLIDCGSCSVRGAACGGCVVSVLLGAEPGTAPEAPGGAAAPVVGGGAAPPVVGDPDDERERHAIQVLAEAGFEVTVLSRETARPQLRLVGSSRRRPYAA